MDDDLSWLNVEDDASFPHVPNAYKNDSTVSSWDHVGKEESSFRNVSRLRPEEWDTTRPEDPSQHGSVVIATKNSIAERSDYVFLSEASYNSTTQNSPVVDNEDWQEDDCHSEVESILTLHSAFEAATGKVDSLKNIRFSYKDVLLRAIAREEEEEAKQRRLEKSHSHSSPCTFFRLIKLPNIPEQSLLGDAETNDPVESESICQQRDYIYNRMKYRKRPIRWHPPPGATKVRNRLSSRVLTARTGMHTGRHQDANEW